MKFLCSVHLQLTLKAHQPRQISNGLCPSISHGPGLSDFPHTKRKTKSRSVFH